MSIDITQLELLLSEGKFDEAKSLLSDLSQQPMDAAQKGGAIANVATMYIDTMNRINIKYRDALKHALSDIDRVNASERKVLEKVRLDEVKKSLNIN